MSPKDTSQGGQQRKPLPDDSETLEDLMQMVPSEGVIEFLRTFSFGNTYRQDFMNPLYQFIDLRGGPEHEFIDPELEQLRKGLRGSIQTFLSVLRKNTFRQRESGSRHTVCRIPDEWEMTQGRRYHQAIEEMNAAAENVCKRYDGLVRTARAKVSMEGKEGSHSPIWMAVQHIARAIGETEIGNALQRSRDAMRQAAIDGKVRIWGRRQIGSLQAPTFQFDTCVTEAPRDYWKTHKIAGIASAQPLNPIYPFTTSTESDSPTWATAYADLRVDKAEINALWSPSADSPEVGSVPPPSETAAREGSPLFDVFVSHATENKNYVVPLVKSLEAAGIRVWFDQNTLEWGDDLRSSIDRGLANCRYGIVVFSKAFLGKKKWTEYELNSLFALEKVGRKVILPIWHGITRDDLIQYSPAFADRLAKISSTDSYEEIVESLLAMLGRAKPTTSSEPATDTKKATKMQTMSIRDGVPLKSGSTVPLSDRETEVIVSSLGNTPYSPAPIPPQTEAARRLCDATRELQKASWSYVELHSRYGVAQAVRDVIAEEKEIFDKIGMASEIFERDYDLPADLARVAKEELANIKISLDRLTSGHDLDSMKIAAEQVQDSCNRVRESAKPYAYLKSDAGETRRVEKLELPVARPIIVPKRYGGGTTKDDFGYTGLGVVNDGEQPGYDLTIHNIQLKDETKLVFHRGHTERLTTSDGEAFYPAFLEARLGGTFGSGLFDFMRERGIQSITVPITYRDSYNNWFQTDVTFERDVQKSGGLRLGWKQKRISGPTSEVMSTSSDVSSIVTEPAQAMTRNVETVLSVMTERKNWKRTDLAKLANISDDDALRALRTLKDADKVIPIDVDEEPKGTFWRRI